MKAETPLSAIDWLSQTFAEPAAVALPRDESPVTRTAAVESVTVQPLNAPSVDAVGLLPTSITGLPRDLWKGSDVTQLRRLLAELPVDQLPAAHRLSRMVLLAEATPPLGADGALFAARLDALLARGQLEEASSMLTRAGALQSKPDPALFARAFDLSLLLGQEDRGCARLKDAPGLTPALPVRIFCLSRNGDWAAAAVTLDSAGALGEVSAADRALLARFLDPELYEGTPALRPTGPVSPLTFRMFEAIGEPIPTSTLPLAFAHSDLRGLTGWKPRITAAERLTRAGALQPNALLGVYTERKASASGGSWERVRAIQALETALDGGDSDQVATALARAWTEFQGAGLEPAFAEIIGPRLETLDLTGTPAALAFQIGLLSPRYEAVANTQSPSDATGAFLVSLAQGLPDPAKAPDGLSRAIADAWHGAVLPPSLVTLIDEGRVGEAILEALILLNSGAKGEESDLTAGLAALRGLGLEETARRAGLELMLLGPL